MKKLLSLALGLIAFVSACAAAPQPAIYRNWATTNLNPAALNVVTQIVSSLTSTGGISLTQATNVAAAVVAETLIASNNLWVARNGGTASNVTLHGTATVGTNALVELRVQDDNGSDAFAVQLRGYHGMAAPSFSLGHGITWAVPDESGFVIGMSLTVANVQDPAIVANGSAFDNTMVGLGYSLLATNGSFAIGRNNRSWGANAGVLGVGLSNGVANTIDIGLHDPAKLSVGTNRLTIRTPVFGSSLSSNASVVSFLGRLATGEWVETDEPSGGALPQTLNNLNIGAAQNQTNQSGLAKDAAIQFMNAASTVLITIPHNSTALNFPEGFTAPSAVIDGTDLAPWVTFLGIADPNADRILFWDDSAGAFKYLTLGDNLTITDDTLDAAGGVGANFYGQNSVTNLIVTNSVLGGSATLTFSNSAGNAVSGFRFYATNVSVPNFEIYVLTNTFTMYPNATTEAPFLTMTRSTRTLLLGYGGATSLDDIDLNADVTVRSNLVVEGNASIAGTGSPQHTFGGGSTNYSTKLADSSVTVTNLVGLRHVSAATPLAVDANASHDWSVTNRISAATTLVFTNTADGQTISLVLLGEASGGSSRVVTLIPQLGHLVANLDTFGSALALSSSFTLTNGNAAEISWAVRRLNGTNIASYVTRQFAF